MGRRSVQPSTLERKRSRSLALLAALVAGAAGAGYSCDKSILDQRAPVLPPIEPKPPIDASDADAPDYNCDRLAAPVPGLYNPHSTCWVPTGWDLPCRIERAREPELGAPPLAWQPCGDELPGCSTMALLPMFDDVKHLGPRGSVVRWGDGYRIGVLYNFASPISPYSTMVALYDVDGTALAVWRVRHDAEGEGENSGGCQLVRPIVTPERVWLGAQYFGWKDTFKSTSFAPRWEALDEPFQQLQFRKPHQGWWASSQVMVAWLFDGMSLYVEDIGSGRHFTYPGGNGGPFGYPRAAADRVLAMTAPDEFVNLVLWDRATEAMTPLVDPAIGHVVDGNTDGSTLAWILVHHKGADGSLWTSPLAATPEQLTPLFRRTTPPLGAGNSAAGSGYYALFSSYDPEADWFGDGRVHVYRLEDAREWSFPIPAGIVGAAYFYHVDADEVFYSGNGPLTRQRLDALGAGSPAP